MEDFIKNYIEKSERFILVKYAPSEYSKDKSIFYGEAKDKTGMTVINWCTEGHSCTYFGEPLEPNISVCIKKDGGTRTAFSGYCFAIEDFERFLKCSW